MEWCRSLRDGVRVFATMLAKREEVRASQVDLAVYFTSSYVSKVLRVTMRTMMWDSVINV